MSKKLKAEKQADAVRKSEEQKKRELEAIEQKKQAEKKKREQLELEEAQRLIEQQKERLLNKLMVSCLDKALNGGQNFRISYYSVYLDLSNYLELKGFYFTEEAIERDPIIILDRALKKLNAKELIELKKKLKTILESLQILKIELANIKISRILQETNDFLYCEKALLFLSKNLYQPLNEDDADEEIYPEFPRQEALTLLIKKHHLLIRKFIPSSSYDEEEEEEDENMLYILNWDVKNEDQINDNWFNAINMNWISSKAGKEFFDEFLMKINKKTEALSDSLLFDSFERSANTYLILENGAKLKTPIPLLQLLEIFEIFGYKKRVPKADKSGYIKDIKISWKN